MRIDNKVIIILVGIQRTIGVVNAEKPHKRTPVQHSENTKLSKFVDGA